jgi:hypothetical protein
MGNDFQAQFTSCLVPDLQGERHLAESGGTIPTGLWDRGLDWVFVHIPKQYNLHQVAVYSMSLRMSCAILIIIYIYIYTDSDKQKSDH